MSGIYTHDRETDEDRIDRIVEEFTDRLNAGESPEISEYERRHPDLAPLLRDLLSSLEALNRDASRVGEFDAAMRHPKPLTVGVVGDYRIVREIGRGGMAVVYEAEHEKLRRRVALKVLTSHPGDHFQQRFEREARSVAKLHHTHIVPVYEYGESAGIHFIAMQFIDGHRLDEVLKRKRTGSIHSSSDSSISGSGSSSNGPVHFDLLGRSTRKYFRAVARITADVANAISYAHRNRILHRDIKPSNLLLDREGNIWVTDFGLAKTEEEDLTHTGDIIGTVRYMAPEQLSGQYDARSDVYSLGATLYEMLTLRPAFDATDRLRLMRQISQTDPPRPRTIDPSVPTDLETIVLKALSKAPDQRYQSVNGFEKDLRRFLDDKPIAARRATQAEHLWRWCRRNPALSATISLLLGSFVLGFLGVFWQWQRAEQHLAEAVEQRRAAEHNLTEADRMKMLATNNAEEATRQHQRAEQNLAEAHNAVEDFTKIIDEYCAGKSEQMQLHRDVLAKALRYYEEFLKQQPDEQPSEELAKIYVRVARLRAVVGSADLALADYQQAVSLYRPLVVKRPADFELRKAMFESQNSLGYYQIAVGQYDTGIATLLDIVEQIRPFVQQRPDDRQLESMLSRAYHNLGYVYINQNRLSQSEHYLSLAVEIHERLAGDDPDLPLVKLYISVAYSYLQAGDGDRALETYQKALVISQQLATHFPDERRYKDYVAWCHNKIGDAHRFLRRFEDAEEHYIIAITMHEQLVTDEPAINVYRSHLANDYGNLGDCYRQLQRFTDGIESYAKQIVQLRKSLLRTSSAYQLRVTLKNALHRTALCLEGNNQPELARQYWRDAIQCLREAKDTPDNGSERIFTELQKSYHVLAEFEIRMGDLENAEAVIQERTRYSQGDPDNLFRCAIQFGNLAAAVEEHRPSWPAEEQQAKAQEYIAHSLAILQQSLKARYSDVAQLESDSGRKVVPETMPYPWLSRTQNLPQPGVSDD